MFKFNVSYALLSSLSSLTFSIALKQSSNLCVKLFIIPVDYCSLYFCNFCPPYLIPVFVYLVKQCNLPRLAQVL